MPGYNFYVSDKKNPELVEAFNKMKADEILSEFIVESCEVNLPLFLDRKIAENEAQKKWFESLKDVYLESRDKIVREKEEKKLAYIKIVPKNRDARALMNWLTSPATIKDWQAAGFKSAQEVLEMFEKVKQK